MKKYYAQVKTNAGKMSLAVKAKNETEAENKINKIYNVDLIIQIGDKPVKSNTGRPTSSTLNVLGMISRGNRTTKRFKD